MVTYPLQSTQLLKKQKIAHPLKWIAVDIQEVVKKGYRLDAKMYGLEGRKARSDLDKCKSPITTLCGEQGLATAYHRPRFKRIYVEKSDFPIYQPSQVNELHPKPAAYISELTKTDIRKLKVKKGQILLTCSGTIGNCMYVRNTIEDFIFSHDLIRIDPKEYGGFIYAFLKSKIGFIIINTNNYGAVVSHIEPEHLNNVPIPNPPSALKQKIHNLINDSFKLRDESNDLVDEAQTLLKEGLQLPNIEKLIVQARQFGIKTGVTNYSVTLNDLNNRLDGSYHVPIVDVIESHLQKNALTVTNIGDKKISHSVILPGRFKRIYVEEGNGIVFFGGKQIYELNPINKKYLSLLHHRDRIKSQLTLRENMTMLTCSGTVGKVAIAPKHWEGWTANQHIIRIIPANKEIAGYIYAWLSSDYAYPLITRFVYGAVVDEIDDKQVSQIKIPLLRDSIVQKKINDKILEANKKRTRAYKLEQQALKTLDEKVIYAQ